MPDFLIRKATGNDLSAIETIYNKIHDAEAAGLQTTGWIRGVYPVRQTAEDGAPDHGRNRFLHMDTAHFAGRADSKRDLRLGHDSVRHLCER